MSKDTWKSWEDKKNHSKTEKRFFIFYFFLIKEFPQIRNNKVVKKCRLEMGYSSLNPIGTGTFFLSLEIFTYTDIF